MEANGMSRRERKKQETKAAILKAARHLFEEKGYDSVSIEEITEKSDVSKGTFFNYFSSKESLMAGIAEDEVEDILILAEDDLKDIQGALEKIRLILRRLLEDAIPYLKLTGKIMISSIINTGDNPSPFSKINSILEGIVAEGQANGEITDLFKAMDIVTALLGSYYGVIFKWFEAGCVPGKPDELDTVLDLLLTGIKGPGSK